MTHPRWAAALRDRVGRRGAALLFFALVDLVYCYALLNPPAGAPLPEAYRWPQVLMPLWAWAVVWGAVGVVCVVYAFRRHDAVAFTAAVALYIAWGVLALTGQALGVAQRGYVTGVIFLGFAAFVYLIGGGIPAGAPPRRGAGS